MSVPFQAPINGDQWLVGAAYLAGSTTPTSLYQGSLAIEYCHTHDADYSIATTPNAMPMGFALAVVVQGHRVAFLPLPLGVNCTTPMLTTAQPPWICMQGDQNTFPQNILGNGFSTAMGTLITAATSPWDLWPSGAPNP